MSADPRDEIAEAVQYGRMTPSEAEGKLKELGLPPLVPQPDQSNFDPMSEVFWTVPMVVAWIAWRSDSAVTEAWDEYRSQTWYWEQKQWQVGVDDPVVEGWFPQPAAPGSLAILSVKESHQRAHHTFPTEAMGIGAARQQLWRALGDGIVKATGVHTGTGLRNEIPAFEWRDLAPILLSGRDVVRRREKRGGVSSGGYDDIALERRAIVATWPSRRWEQPLPSLPPTMAPDGPGYMPLYCAAQWIATRGGTFAFDPTDTKVRSANECGGR